MTKPVALLSLAIVTIGLPDAVRGNVSSGIVTSGTQTLTKDITHGLPTAEPLTYFDAWSTMGGFQVRQFRIYERHVGFGDLLHSAVSAAYGGTYGTPNRYFRKQTCTSSWSNTSPTSSWIGSFNFEIGQTVMGSIFLVSAAWQEERTQTIQKTNEYGFPLGIWYTNTTTLHATLRPDAPQGVPVFDGYRLTDYGEPDRPDTISSFTNQRISLTPYVGANYATAGSFFRYTPPGVWTSPPDPWTESSAAWHVDGYDYSITLSEEDTLQDIQSRIEQDRALSSLETIPWNRERTIQHGEILYENTVSSGNVSLYNNSGSLTTTGEFSEAGAQLRFVVPVELRIPGVGYCGRVIEYFSPRTDPNSTQIVKIHEVDMREGQWESAIINPVMRSEDGWTKLKNFSAVAELIQAHPTLVLPLPEGAPPSAVPAEYQGTKPTFVWQTQAVDSNGTGQISRRVLTGSMTLQQINLADSHGSLDAWIQATVKWSILSGSTAAVRLWHWRDDGSPLGAWQQLSADADLKNYFGTDTDFIFAELLSPGTAGIRITISIDDQTIHDDLRFNSVSIGLVADANRDGTINLDGSDAPSSVQPYRFWLNDDIDGSSQFILDSNDAVVNGDIDLREDFFPVFLDLANILSGAAPGGGFTYKLRHAEEALNLVYTDLTRGTAFDFRDGDQGDPAAYPRPLFQATTVPVTSQGVELPDWFLAKIRDEAKGVILVEARAPTTAPLVLLIERDGVVIAETTLPLSIGQDILLLLHGMNSNVHAWDTFLDSSSVYTHAVTIADGAIQGPAPRRSREGLRFYRVQFGSYDMASTRVGLEGITAANVPGYNAVGTRCGDFQTFEELGQEVDNAITLLMARHANARIVLLGHSRGGLSARAYLESPYALPTKAVVKGLVTTSSPHMGSRMGRIYGWLNTHPRSHPDTNDDDWEVVDFLLSPYGGPPALDVRRPVILDVADNSLALSNLNSASALQHIPVHVRCAEIQYAKARFGLLLQDPIKYSVLETTGLGGPLAPQLSSQAIEFLLNGGDAGGVDFIGDGLIPRARQRFTQLAGFSGIALPSRVITDRDVVHIEAPKQVDDMMAQLKAVAPDIFR